MATNEANLLPTPADYATAEQLRSIREMAKALAQGNHQQPVVRHWSQGMSNLLGSVIGNYQMADAGRRERGSQLHDNSRVLRTGGEQPAGGAPAAGAKPMGYAADNGVASAPVSNDLDDYLYRTRRAESNFDNNAKNPRSSATGPDQFIDSTWLANFDATFPERAHLPAAEKLALRRDADTSTQVNRTFTAGNEKVLSAAGIPVNDVTRYGAHFFGSGDFPKVWAAPDNVPIGQVVQPRTMAANPHLQNMTVGQAKAWLGRKMGGAAPARPGPQAAAPVLPFLGADPPDTGMAGGTASPALAFSGKPINEAGGDDPQGAIVRALAAGGRGGGVAPGNPTVPGVPGGAVRAARPAEGTPGAGVTLHVDPNLAPTRPRISREDFVNTMASTHVSPELKQATLQAYLSQNQPVDVATTGGRVVLDPRDPRKQQFHPEVKWGTTKLPGGLEIDSPMVLTPSAAPGGPQVKYLDQAPSGAQARPGVPGIAPAAAPAAPGSDPDLDSAPLLKFAPDGVELPAEGGAAGPEAGGGALPYGAAGQAAAATAAAVEPPQAPAGTQVAQARLPQRALDLYEQGVQLETDRKFRTEHSEKAAQNYAKEYDSIRQAGRLAQQNTAVIKTAQQLLEDPRFVTGAFSGVRLDINRLRALVSQNPEWAAPTEIFDKIIAGNTLEDMKIILQGLGQVRVAEINLLSQATANRNNTLPANRAVLQIMQRAHDRAADISKFATAYAQGIRWDKDGNPYRASAQPTGLDYGFDAVRQRYLDKHPLFTDQEIANYGKFLKADPKAAANAKKALAESAKVYSPESKPVGKKPPAPGNDLPPGATLD